MNVGEGWRIGNDGVRKEWFSRIGGRLNAGSPAPIKHLRYHLAFLADLALLNRLHIRNQTGVLDHILWKSAPNR